MREERSRDTLWDKSVQTEEEPQAIETNKHSRPVKFVWDKSVQSLQMTDERIRDSLWDMSVQTKEEGQQADSIGIRPHVRSKSWAEQAIKARKHSRSVTSMWDKSVPTWQMREETSRDSLWDKPVQTEEESQAIKANKHSRSVACVFDNSVQTSQLREERSRDGPKRSSSGDAYQAMHVAARGPGVSRAAGALGDTSRMLPKCDNSVQTSQMREERSRDGPKKSSSGDAYQAMHIAAHLPGVSRAPGALDDNSRILPLCDDSRDRATWELDDFPQQVAPLEASQQDMTVPLSHDSQHDTENEHSTSFLELRSRTLPLVFPALHLRSVVQSDWSEQSLRTRNTLGTLTLSRPPRQRSRWRHVVATGGISNRDAETILHGSWGRPSSRFSCRSSSPLVN